MTKFILAAVLAATCSTTFAQDAAESTSHADKSYYVQGALNLAGTIGYVIHNSNGTTTITADEVANDSTTTTSGNIRLALIITTAPIVSGQAFSYWVVAYLDGSPLLPNYHYTDIDATVTTLPVPDGIYYIHMGVFEQEVGCTSTGPVMAGYCSDEVRTFSGQVQVSGGVFTNYTAPPAGTATAVEFFYAQLGHYFSTAQQDEINALDTGYFPGWTRTGQTFKLWTSGAAYADVCRFFTSIYATHFYTALAPECALVKQNPVWTYEKIAGKVQFPTGGVCPAGTQYLYRLFNNGIGGYPNHRYTVSLVIRAQMIAAGWSPEDDNTVCVPL